MKATLLTFLFLTVTLTAHAQSIEGPIGFTGVDWGRYQWLPGDYYDCTAKRCDMQGERFSMTPMWVLVQRTWDRRENWDVEYRAFRERWDCIQSKLWLEHGIDGRSNVEEPLRCVYDSHWRTR